MKSKIIKSIQEVVITSYKEGKSFEQIVQDWTTPEGSQILSLIQVQDILAFHQII